MQDSLYVQPTIANEVSDIAKTTQEIINVVVTQGFGIAIVAGVLYAVWMIIKGLNSSGKSFDEEFGENAEKYIRILMMMSSVGAMVMFIMSAASRGVMVSSAMIRFIVIGFVEMIAYFFFTKTLSKQLADNKFEIREILVSSLSFSFGIITTRLMQMLYYEAEGVVKIVFDSNSFFPKFVTNQGAPIEISAITLIWSTPFFALFLGYFMYNKMQEERQGKIERERKELEKKEKEKRELKEKEKEKDENEKTKEISLIVPPKNAS